MQTNTKVDFSQKKDKNNEEFPYDNYKERSEDDNNFAMA